MSASGTRLGPASLSQLAQYEIGNSTFGIVTHSVIPVSMCSQRRSMTAPPFFVFIPCDFLPYAPVGSCILGPCVPVLISSLRMYSRSPCALPSVVLICFTLRTRYTVSYITCTVIYLVPQSEYRTCSPPSNLFPLRYPQLAPRSFALGPSPRRPCQIGSASDSETVRKPLAVLLPSFVFPPARNITPGRLVGAVNDTTEGKVLR
jgi:hypothetical protein